MSIKTRIKKLKIKTVLGAIIVIAICVSIWYLIAALNNNKIYNDMDNIAIPENTKLLLFSPHNDDEALSSTTLIRKVLAKGGQVKVVIFTNGDGFKWDIRANNKKWSVSANDYYQLGLVRQKESTAALTSMGIDPKNIIFLGYPDGGLDNLWEINWSNNQPYFDPSIQSTVSLYPNSYQGTPNLSGINVTKAVSKIITQYQPDMMIYPHPNDNHPDHAGVNTFVEYSLGITEYRDVPKYLYLTHWELWPMPVPEHSGIYLLPPAELQNKETIWHTLPMNPDDQTKKLSVISKYKSQLVLTKFYLDAFVKSNELFGEYPNVILKTAAANSKIIPTDDNLLMTDMVKEKLSLIFSSCDDITNFNGELDKSNNLHLMMTMNSDLDRDTNYHMELTLIGKSETKRITFTLQQDMLFTVGSNNKAVMVPDAPNVWHISFPIDNIKSYSSFIIQGDSYDAEKQVDKTIRRMVLLSTT